MAYLARLDAFGEGMAGSMGHSAGSGGSHAGSVADLGNKLGFSDGGTAHSLGIQAWSVVSAVPAADPFYLLEVADESGHPKDEITVHTNSVHHLCPLGRFLERSSPSYLAFGSE